MPIHDYEQSVWLKDIFDGGGMAAIVAYSILCRADWVRNDPVLTTRADTVDAPNFWTLARRIWINKGAINTGA
jgi:hypothetical protein